MSISLSVEFQQNLYKSMERNGELKALVANIYQSTKTNPKYPYILQHVNSVKRLKSSLVDSYCILGEINIFVRDNSFSDFKNIISKIEQIFKTHSSVPANYNFISAKITEADFTPSQDQLTTRLKLNYEALIQSRLER